MLLRIIITSALLLNSFCAIAFAVERTPQAFLDTKIVERLNSTVSQDVRLIKPNGEGVNFASLLGEKPVLLNFVYYSCPKLCHFVTAAMVDSLKQVPLSYLNGLRVITISFDHRDTVKQASEFKQRYLDSVERDLGTSLDWEFYIADEAEVRKIADSVGFKYYYNETSNQYAHSAGLILLSPQGIISRYLYGIEFDPKDLKLSIIEAQKNKSLSSVDSILLFCYNYDPLENTYILQSAKLMKIAGAITVFVLVFLIIYLKLKEKGINNER